MANRIVGMSEPELERMLVDLGRNLDYPQTPDLAAAVSGRLLQRAEPRSDSLWTRLLPLRRPLAIAVAALIVIAAAVLALSPEARTAVANRLGLRGVEITHVPAAPTAVPLGQNLHLGRRTTLEDVRAQVAFTIEVPSALGAPDDVYLLDSPPGGQVALLYAPRNDVPVANTTGVGVLLTEFQGDFGPAGPIAIGKGLPPGTNIEDVTINGANGYWINGDPHVFFFRDARGQFQNETTRLAANVLLWEHGSVTFRLESALSRDAAVAIATSMK